ncbi:MAG: molecular chaperone HtpG, partial [Bacteroidota bacterium]
KDIVPEFLMLLQGVIDSPDIPLNVSRSYLQGDPNVKKINAHITKKVAEKLASLFKKDREGFESKWGDIGVFVKYGMISEEKFYDKAIKFAMVKTVDDKFYTVEEIKDKVRASQTDKYDKIVLPYTNNVDDHNAYIQSAKNRGYEVLVFDHILDNHFLQTLEQKVGDITFVRVDSETSDNLIQKDETTESVLSEKEQEKVKGIFETAVKDSGGTIALKALSPEDHPVLITKPEFMRRMKEMQELQGMKLGDMPEMFNVVINTNHPLVADKMTKMRSQEKKDEFAKYLFDLARLNQSMLKGKELTDFINRSIEFMK